MDMEEPVLSGEVPLKEIDLARWRKPKREVNRVFIHCSAANRPQWDDVSVIDAWHLKRGWNGVGYHYFIKMDGTIQPGRSLEKKPASAKGHNTGTIAICLHGLYTSDFTFAQMESLTKLCTKINLAYAEKVTFHGHCEVSNKPCPVFDYQDVLNLDAQGNMVRLDPRYLEMFCRGNDVRDLQRQLNIFFHRHAEETESTAYEITPDGIFGQVTAQSVVYFQMAHQIPPDGVVGANTIMRLPPLNED